MNKELPEDALNKIYQQAKDYSQVVSLDDSEPKYNELKRIGYIEGAIEYASLYLKSERKRKEAMELLEPILDWGQNNPELILGTSITAEVLRRAKGYKIATDARQKDFDTEMEAEVAKRYSDPESEFAQDFQIGASWAKAFLSPSPATEHVDPEAFAEWVDIEAVRIGAHKWTIGAGDATKKYTTSELLTLYKQTKQG